MLEVTDKTSKLEVSKSEETGSFQERSFEERMDIYRPLPMFVNNINYKRMRNLLFIFITILVGSCCTFGQQVPIVNKTFHGHLQTCNVVGTMEEDFVVELFSDSSFKLTKYRTSYVDQYKSVQRQVFYGNYIVNLDTVLVMYSKQNIDFKGKTKTSRLKENTFISLRAPWPTGKFILSIHAILPSGDPFYRLDEIPPGIAKQLESNFGIWDHQRFSNKRFGI